MLTLLRLLVESLLVQTWKLVSIDIIAIIVKAYKQFTLQNMHEVAMDLNIDGITALMIILATTTIKWIMYEI